MIVAVDSSNVDHFFEGILVDVDEISYTSHKPGWKCRTCGKTFVTEGLPPKHWCPTKMTGIHTDRPILHG